MKEIIDWLITVERLANDFYTQASHLFHDDPKLSLFLEHLAEDEAYHYHLMGRAGEYILRTGMTKPADIIIDEEIKLAIEKPFTGNMLLLQENKLTKDQVLTSIIDSEFSEWNDIFLYVINTIKQKEKVFESAAAKIQHHLNYIEHYLGTTQSGREQLAKFPKLTEVWDEKILIVDDDETISALLVAVLQDDWKIEVAYNGEEAFDKIKTNYYNLIISDIDMPIMDGIELYKKASTVVKNLHRIFIFHSGNISQIRPRLDDFQPHRIKAIKKPSSILEIKQIVKETLQDFPVAKEA